MSELIERIEKIGKQGIEQSELIKKLLLSLTRLDNKTVEFESVFNQRMNLTEVIKNEFHYKIEDISVKLVS